MPERGDLPRTVPKLYVAALNQGSSLPFGGGVIIAFEINTFKNMSVPAD